MPVWSGGPPGELRIGALRAGLIAGGLGALVLLVARRTGRGAFTAYGPYLMLGMFLGMLARRGG